jgi:DNA-nicking Smr family endonuclease
MDFGKILDQWDKRGGPVYDKDADSSALTGNLPDRRGSSAIRRKKLLRKSPEATLDLHGLNQDEAWNALTVFFNDAKNKGLEKVLVIHGKGNHAGEGGREQTGVLKKMVRDFVERCPFAGESGFNNGREGGEGASWVLLKNNGDQRSR